MSIFILEDDVVQAQSLRQLVEELCTAHFIPYDFIEASSKSQELLAKIPQCTYTPIYFLDIEIKGDERKGLEVAQEIRKIDTQGIIVFITTHSELAPISYQYMVSALTFIDKNDTFITRRQMLESCLQHYANKNQLALPEDVLCIENSYTIVKVPFTTVEYVMTDEPHRLQLITTSQLIQFYGTLKEVEQLDVRLLRCHKSYLVNELQLQAIDYTNQMLILKSGKSIPVSRRMLKHVKSRLKER